MTSCVIIDDEIRARENLKLQISRNCPQLTLIGEADSVSAGYDLIQTNHPDIIFLDIEMTDGTGFDLLDRLQIDDKRKVIFVTGYDHFAAKAFRYAAIDYLIKPPSAELLIEAVKKTESENYYEDIVKKLSVLTSNRKSIDKIALPFMKGIQMVTISEIIYCESEGNYTRFFLKDNKQILATKILKEYDELLAENSFIRIHRSYLANINAIDKYIDGQGGKIILSNGTELEVSKRKKKELVDALMNRT